MLPLSLWKEDRRRLYFEGVARHVLWVFYSMPVPEKKTPLFWPRTYNRRRRREVKPQPNQWHKPSGHGRRGKLKYICVVEGLLKRRRYDPRPNPSCGLYVFVRKLKESTLVQALTGD